MKNVRAKFKKCRKLGSRIYEKCLSPKYVLSEQKKKFLGRRKISDYGKQLNEKQKVRLSYVLKEKKLKEYVLNAINSNEETFGEIYKNLESRLDNVIYRSGLSKSRANARQIVSHGHVYVNGRRLNIPSHAMKIGDIFEIKEQSRDKSFFQTLSMDAKVPK